MTSRVSVPALLVCLVALGTSHAHADLSSGLAAYFPFDGNADDASGNGNHGTVLGATLTEDRLGNPNSAYSFDGEEDYIRTVDAASLNITGDLTISAWIRTPGQDFGRIIFSNLLEVSPTDGYSLRTNNEGGLHFISGNEHLLGQTSVITDDWTHVAVTLSGSTAVLYVNGSLDASGTVGVPTTSSVDQTVGASYSPFYFWNGSLDDIRVYSRALSPAEIQQLHAVPEPAGIVLAGMGVAVLVAVVRRRCSARAS